MNQEETKAVRWLYNDRRDGRAARAVAFEFLLGPLAAGRTPDIPREWADFNGCLNLLRDVPEAAPGVDSLARRSPYWRAFRVHWNDLTRMLSQETGGTMVYPWPRNTDRAVRGLIDQVASGMDPAKTTLADQD